MVIKNPYLSLEEERFKGGIFFLASMEVFNLPAFVTLKTLSISNWGNNCLICLPDNSVTLRLPLDPEVELGVKGYPALLVPRHTYQFSLAGIRPGTDFNVHV